ncbi:hypothetical protein [Lacipirellula parvula]|uniref:Uncharacterized protein n=1 Tax=Lacipirellula parvula TaxID=2650471 RepID=A0A5K7X8D5_9BACT|nr:hypothetical protein [Lacipirellula parvula]BBO33064.1 hypothetical protein PLANPX_2676 [Lacipirellula parvula]
MDVREGRQDEPGGRVWDVRTQPGKEPKASGRKAVEAGSGDEAAVLAAMQSLGTAETKGIISAAAKRSGKQVGTALEAMIASGKVRKCRIAKGTRPYDGFELVEGVVHAT